MVSVVVAKYEEDDDAICELAKLSPFTKGFVAFRRLHQQNWTAYERQEIAKALQGSKLVGFVYAKKYKNKPGGVIHFMGVHPDRQSRGIGTALVKWARAMCDGPIVLSCEEANFDANEFYRLSGFKVLARGAYGQPPNQRPYIRWRLP